MKNIFVRRKKGFTLIESIMSLSILGLIVLMSAPLLTGRSQQTSGFVCENSGSKLYIVDPSGSEFFDFKVKEGMNRVWITAIFPGDDGEHDTPPGYGKNENDNYGHKAGDTYKPYYVNNGLGVSVKNGEYDNINFEMNDAYITIRYQKNADNLKTETIEKNDTKLNLKDPTKRLTCDRSTSFTPTTYTSTKTYCYDITDGAQLRAGVPNFGEFLGPLYGTGGYGTFRNANEHRTTNKRVRIFVEWSGTCVPLKKSK